ncbi:MAG: HU family DNA-binding protein [Clostridia bacterium]|jgi:DNA-binding protein HU-beta|nr:HU family DNA-binding protein [Clostridia bacterium]MBQ4447315.1 HU family DNA-binding protein [Clostridia bacterium]
MNKAQLINAIAAKCDLPKKDIDAVVNATFDTIIETMKAGEKVQIVGFGRFEVRERPARTGRNPMTGEAIEIAASRSAAFKAGNALKEALEQK